MDVQERDKETVAPKNPTSPARNRTNRTTRATIIGGLATGLATLSMSAIGSANASCVSFSGFGIGGGCQSSFGSFALVIGSGQATANGFLTAAISTGSQTTSSTDGLLSLAYAGGTGSSATTLGALNFAAAGFGFEGPLGVGSNISAVAGLSPSDVLNLAFNVGAAEAGTTNETRAGNGAFNIAGNFLGTSTVSGPQPNKNMLVQATGFGNAALTAFGNRNLVSAMGTLNAAINMGSPVGFPNGSDNQVSAGTPDRNALLSLAFNGSGAESVVRAVGGPFAVAATLFRPIHAEAIQNGPGITIRTPSNPTGVTSTLHTKTTQERQNARNTVTERITNSLKKTRDAVGNATRRLNTKDSEANSTARKAKAGATKPADDKD
ncbi:hypothetical protein [Mycolicibacterium neworleansense]|uniref:Uncharacterized protein n=1 Tax=Mycolicibacterium neworleansense TaxID=146018 RepID=A0A0H5RNU3_9MYCO|nr:hypothetical protein [Mycolicibacterium neworleansense]MCV7365013.1 hypothetical protein [Mycolicibacterium neworleansense]CRZ15815.1 hypothetical protein BN2156_02678 [Mycolicibacterium neworleansense]